MLECISFLQGVWLKDWASSGRRGNMLGLVHSGLLNRQAPRTRAFPLWTAHEHGFLVWRQVEQYQSTLLFLLLVLELESSNFPRFPGTHAIVPDCPVPSDRICNNTRDRLFCGPAYVLLRPQCHNVDSLNSGATLLLNSMRRQLLGK